MIRNTVAALLLILAAGTAAAATVTNSPSVAANSLGVRNHATPADLAAAGVPRVVSARGASAVVAQSLAGMGKGGQRYRWDAASTETADGFFIVNPTGNPGAGRWISAESDLSLTMGGARCNDSTDDQAAIVRTLAAAKLLGRRAYVEPGICRHSGQLVVDSVDLFGAGTKSELKSTDATTPNPTLNVLLTGDGPKLRNLKITTTWAGARQSNTSSQAVSLVDATDFEVSGLVVVGSASAGILGQYARRGRVYGNDVSATLADGIHFTNDSHDVEIVANQVRSSGDDCIALVSYNAARPVEYGGGNWPQSSRFIVAANQVADGSARGVSIIGSADVIVSGNYASATGGAGFAVSSELAYTSYNAGNVRIIGNTATGTATSGVLNHPQFYAYTQGSAAYTMNAVDFIGNRASGSPSRSALRIQGLSSGGAISDVSVSGLSADGTGTIAVLNVVADGVTFKNVNARNFADGVYTITGPGAGSRITIAGTAAVDVFTTPSLSRFVNLNNVTNLSSLEILDNAISGTGAPAAIYGGDGTATTIRPVIRATGNSSNRVAIADVLPFTLNGSNRVITLPAQANRIRESFSESTASPIEIRWTSARHQPIAIEFFAVRDADAVQWSRLRQRVIYTNAAGVGTAGVDYVDTGGGFRYQRTDEVNASAGSVGTWSMTFGSGVVAMIFTPAVSAHVQFTVEASYKKS